MTLFELIQDKISKRQIVAVAAMAVIYWVFEVVIALDIPPEKFVPIMELVKWVIGGVVVVATVAIVSYTILAWKHGPQNVNGNGKPKTDPNLLPDMETDK